MTTDSAEACSTAFRATFQGEQVVNVLSFFRRDLAAMTVFDLTALHGILDDAAADNDSWRHLCNHFDTGYVCSELYSRTHSTTAPVELATAVNLPGGSGGNDVLPMTAALVKWTTAVATRRTRGRTYFSGLNVGIWQTADTDYLDTTFQAAFQTSVNQWVAAWLANTTYGFCIFSRAEQLENDLIPYEEVQGGSVQSRLALQRRRSPGR